MISDQSSPQDATEPAEGVSERKRNALTSRNYPKITIKNYPKIMERTEIEKKVKDILVDKRCGAKFQLKAKKR